jgi:hypothetical protein
MVWPFEALDATEQGKLERALIDILEHFNHSGDETLLARGEYLQAIAVRA